MSSTPRDEPYVGPRPFKREDASRFFGRESESADVVSLSIAHRALLLYAPSGAGKSSLLAAMVVPALTIEHGALVLGPARVSGTLASPTALDTVENIAIHHLLLSLGLPAARANEAGLCEALEARVEAHATSTDAPVVLVIDQFEELFTHHPERWRDREVFLRALGNASERLPSLRIVLSMREEYLAQLVPFARHLPDKLRGRYRLERLRPDAAREAIERPLDSTRRRFAPGAASVLVQSLMRVTVQIDGQQRDVEGEFVEPVHLQVVCRELWSKLPASVTTIDAHSIESVGNVDDALSRYYEACIATIAKEFNVGENLVRAWFEEQLITSAGTRGIVHKGAETTAGMPTRLVERLEDLHIVHAEVRGGAAFYELTHDRLLQPIRRANRVWRDARRPVELDFVGQSLDQNLARWEESGHLADFLLGPAELELVDRWLQSGTAPSQSDALRDFLTRSRIECERREARTAKTALVAAKKQRVILLGVVTVVGTLLVLMSIGGIWAARLYVQAENARKAEVAASEKANAERDRAENAVMIERARLSHALLAQLGHEFDALAQGVSAVLPAYERGTEPPTEALEALRAAVTPLATRVPLTASTVQPMNSMLAAAGNVALAWGAREMRVFDAATGALRFTRRPPDDFTWERVECDRTGARIVALARGQAPTQPVQKLQMQQNARPPDERSHRGLLVAYDAETGVEIESHAFELDGDRLLSLDAAGGRAFFVAGNHLHVISTKATARAPAFESLSPREITLSPDGARGLVLDSQGVALFDLTTGQSIATFPQSTVDTPDDATYACAFTQDSARFAFLVRDDSRGDSRGAEAGAIAQVHACDDGRKLSASPRVAANDSMWIGFVDADRALAIVHVGTIDDNIVTMIEPDSGTRQSEDTLRHCTIYAAPHRSPSLVCVIQGPEPAFKVWDLRARKWHPLALPYSAGQQLDTLAADDERRSFVLSYARAAPALCWAGREIAPDAPLATLLSIAAERLRGRPEHVDLLDELKHARDGR